MADNYISKRDVLGILCDSFNHIIRDDRVLQYLYKIGIDDIADVGNIEIATYNIINTFHYNLYIMQYYDNIDDDNYEMFEILNTRLSLIYNTMIKFLDKVEYHLNPLIFTYVLNSLNTAYQFSLSDNIKTQVKSVSSFISLLHKSLPTVLYDMLNKLSMIDLCVDHMMVVDFNKVPQELADFLEPSIKLDMYDFETDNPQLVTKSALIELIDENIALNEYLEQLGYGRQMRVSERNDLIFTIDEHLHMMNVNFDIDVITHMVDQMIDLGDDIYLIW